MEISLRPLTVEDTDHIVFWRNQDWVLQYFIDQRRLTREGHLKYYKTRIETGIVKQWIICADGKDIGTCFLRDIDYDRKDAEYGVFIGEKEYLSRGIGKYCVKEVVRKAFEEMGLKTVFVRVQKKNPRSVNSFLASGFKMMDRTDHVMIGEKEEEIVFLKICKGEI